MYIIEEVATPHNPRAHPNVTISLRPQRAILGVTNPDPVDLSASQGCEPAIHMGCALNPRDKKIVQKITTKLTGFANGSYNLKDAMRVAS